MSLYSFFSGCSKDLTVSLAFLVVAVGWEDPLGKEMATHASILAWEIPWIKKPGMLQSMRLQKNQSRLSD